MRGIGEPVGDERPGDAGLRVFAGAVDVEHDGVVGEPLVARGELAGHHAGAAVEVRLVDGDDPSGADDRAGGGQRGGDLGRVVRVVVVDPHAAHGAVQFEPAPGAAELLEGGA